MAEDEKKLKAALDVLIKGAKNPEVASIGLGLLFPIARKALDTFDGNSSAANSGHRLSRAEFTAAYFSLDPRRATWGRSEIEGLLQSQAPGVALEQLVNRTQNSALPDMDRVRLRGQLLDALEGAFATGNPQLSSEWVRAVLDVSPVFLRAQDTKPSDLFRTTNEERLRWVLVRPMRGLSPDKRAELVKSSIIDVADISLLCEVFRSVAGDRTADGVKPPFGDNPFGLETEDLRNMLVSRAQQIADKGAFWSQALPAIILWFWRNSGHEEQVKEFVRSAIQNRSVVGRILEIPISEVVSTAGNYFQVQNSWSNIFDLNILDKIANELIQSGDEIDGPRAEQYLTARQNARENSF